MIWTEMVMGWRARRINMKIKNKNEYLKLYYLENYLFDVIGKRARKRGYLNFDEFFEICMWKSRRPKNRYLKNQNQIEKITQKAFQAQDEIDKINLICSLNGVGIPTASALLTVVYPRKYGIMDIRCVEMLQELKFNIKNAMSVKNWLKYLVIMRKLAKENKVTPRQLDMILFVMHNEKLNKENYKNLYR
jgi:thermostable 8-oxoguanine DNA glycosylase